MQPTDLSFVFDDNPHPMWIYELSTLSILKVNKAAVDKYGYSEDEFLGLNITDLRPPEEHDRLYSYLKQRPVDQKDHRGISHGGVWKHQHKNGEVIYVEITSHNATFQNKECRVVIATDASEKMLFQEELIWTKSNLEALINNTEDQIWSVDKEMRYVYMNRAYRYSILQLTGVEPKDGDSTFLHPGFEVEKMEPVLRQSTCRRKIYHYYRKP